MSGKATVKKVLTPKKTGETASKTSVQPPTKKSTTKDTKPEAKEDSSFQTALPDEGTTAETIKPNKDSPVQSYRSFLIPVMGIPLHRKDSSHTSSENEVILDSYVASNPELNKDLPPSIIPIYERRKHLMFSSEEDDTVKRLGRPSVPYTWRPVKVYHHPPDTQIQEEGLSPTGRIYIHERRAVFSETLVEDGLNMINYKIHESHDSVEIPNETKWIRKKRLCLKTWDKSEIYVQLCVLGFLIVVALILAYFLRMCLNTRGLDLRTFFSVKI